MDSPPPPLQPAPRGLAAFYLHALAREPRMRRYLAAGLVDDVGIAVSAWASFLFQTDVFTDQRARAKLMIPTLACLLLGNVIAGPLADWGRGALAQWRWCLILWGRGVETVALGSLVVMLALGPPTIGRVLPYLMVSAFMKTALRPTRIAFQVDLLDDVALQRSGSDEPLLDEHGRPRLYKKHQLAFGSLSTALQSVASLGGLLLGGVILDLAHRRYFPLFAFDVFTNLGFIAIVAVWCRPGEASAEAAVAAEEPGGVPTGALRTFYASVAEGVRFLTRTDQRPLLGILFGAFLVEVVSEAYDGKMIVRQILHGSEDQIRHALIAWTLVSFGALVALPAIARRARSLGRVFVALMVVDGLAIAAAGRIAGVPVAASILPFAVVLGVDHALTLSASALADVASNSASSAGMRGRIAATFAFVVLLGDLGMETLATAWSERVGIPSMLTQLGAVQVLLVVAVAALGGGGMWRFGLRERGEPGQAQRLASAPLPHDVPALVARADLAQDGAERGIDAG